MSKPVIALVLLMTTTFASVPNLSTLGQSKWKQIVLMRSTREDVEKLVGQSKYRGDSAMYSLEDGSLDVEYYAFNFCEPGRDADWNLPQWTVIEMTYAPDNPPQFVALKLDLGKFRKVHESPHVPDMISYVNDEEGIDYTFEGDGTTLHSIRYSPGKRFKDLRCTERSKQKKPR